MRKSGQRVTKRTLDPVGVRFARSTGALSLPKSSPGGDGGTPFDAAPNELRDAIMEFWPATEWVAAASIAQLESGFDAFALNDTVDAQHPCGAVLWTLDNISISAERSVGYFQINVCNLPPDWEWQRLYNARHNAGTAHLLWTNAGGWSPWYLSALKLGLI